MIHVCTPFDRQKNLGRAYNEAFRRCPDGDWLCVIDRDVMFLTPDAIEIMYQYVEQFPNAGMFTCFTNRIHPLAKDQLYLGAPSDNADVRHWEYIARTQAKSKMKVTEINRHISGFLMLIPKTTWDKVKFFETGQALGVDNQFSGDVLAAGMSIYRMDRLIVWHSYRLENIRDKSHLL